MTIRAKEHPDYGWYVVDGRSTWWPEASCLSAEQVLHKFRHDNERGRWVVPGAQGAMPQWAEACRATEQVLHEFRAREVAP